MAGTNRNRAFRRRGFSLIELSIASSLTVVVMLAVGGALHLMTRGAAGIQNSSRLNADASISLARMRRELGAAVTVTSLSATHIEFTHPDVNADGADDLIIYDWTGVAGAAITRKVGSDTAVPIVENVSEFSMTSTCSIVTLPGETSDVTGEVVLASHESIPSGSTGSFGAGPVSYYSWRGQGFIVSFDDLEYYSLTRAKVYLQGTGTSGTLYVSIRSSSTNTTYEEKSLSLSSLSSAEYLWYEFSFSSLGSMNPGQTYSLILRTNTSSTGLNVGRDEYATNPVGSDYYMMSSNTGGSWSADSWRDCRYILYGKLKYYSPHAGQTTTRKYLTGLAVRLKLAQGTSVAEMTSGTCCLNRPEITGL